jgi:hypothetical protein
VTITPFTRTVPLAQVSRTSPVLIGVTRAVAGSLLEKHPNFRPAAYVFTQDGVSDYSIAPGGPSVGAVPNTVAIITQRIREWYQYNSFTVAALGAKGDYGLPVFLNGWGVSYAAQRRIYGHPLDTLGTHGVNPWLDLSPRCDHAVPEMSGATVALASSVAADLPAHGLRLPQLGILDLESWTPIVVGATRAAWNGDYDVFPGQGSGGAPVYPSATYDGWMAAYLAMPVADPRRTATIYQRFESGRWVDKCINDFFTENLAGYTGSSTTDDLTQPFQAQREALVVALIRLAVENFSYRGFCGVYRPWRSKIPGTQWLNYDIRSSPLGNPAHEAYHHVAVPAIHEDYSSANVYPPGPGSVYPDPLLNTDLQRQGYWIDGQLVPSAGGNRPVIPWLWASGTLTFGGAAVNGYTPTLEDNKLQVAIGHGLGASRFISWREDRASPEHQDSDTLPLVEFMVRYAQPRGIRRI